MRTRILVAVAVLLIAAITVNTVQGVNNANSIRATQGRLEVSLKASAKTRVTTVTQRCALTLLDSEFAADAARIIGEFAPRVVGPFNILSVNYLASYQGCLKQLQQVKRISKETP